MRSRITSIAPRAAADAVLALSSLAIGLGVRLLIKGDPVLPELLNFFESYALLLAVSLLVTFAAFRVYTRNRLYMRKHKLLAIAKATCLSYVIFLGAVYLFKPMGEYIPRGAFLISFAITLAGACGGRLLAGYLDRILVVQWAKPAAKRTIRRVLVVGGAGYIGSVLVRDLLEQGYQVRVLDNMLYDDAAIRDLYGHPAFEVHQGDFREVSPVVKAVKGVDAVIHLGAIVGDPACAVSEDGTLETNLAATRLLADVCRASNVARVLFASTCSVYGAVREVVDEDSELNPVSLYAATKIDSEKVLMAARSPEFHPVIMRLATAFGWSYRPRFDLVVNLLTAKALTEKKIVIYNGRLWRPFIHVRDISAAFSAALRAPLERVSGEVFNVGSDYMNLTLEQLAEKIAGIQPGLEVEHIANSDVRTYRVSFEKIRTRLNFMCKVSLEDGIEEMRYHIEAGAVGDYRDTRYSNVQHVRQKRLVLYPKPPTLELTALRFAKNGRWIRTALEGTSNW